MTNTEYIHQLWHSPEDVPEADNVLCFCKHRYRIFDICASDDWEHLASWYDVERWAYISQLDPRYAENPLEL